MKLKKIFYIIIFTFLLGIKVENVYGAYCGPGGLYCNVPQNLAPYDIMKCEMKKWCSYIQHSTLTLTTYGSNYKIIGVNAFNDWDSVNNDGKKIEFYSEEVINITDDVFGEVIIRIEPDNQSLLSSGYGTINASFGIGRFDTPSDGTEDFTDTQTYFYYSSANQSKLSNISIEGCKLNKDFDTNEFNYYCSTDKDNVVVKYEKYESSSNVSIPSLKNYHLEYGNNQIEIEVTSPNGLRKNIYLIDVNREDNRSKDAGLKKITVDDREINIENNLLNYEIKVPHDKEKPDITCILSSDKATYEILGEKILNTGFNKYTIKVTSEKGNTLEYDLIIEKLSRPLDDNPELKSLTIDNYPLQFKKDIFEYEIKIKNESNLNIKAIPSKETSEINIVGNENLKNDSTILINVRAENGDIHAYQIKIKKENDLPIILGIAFSIIIVLVLFLYIKRKKSLKKSNSLEDNSKI